MRGTRLTLLLLSVLTILSAAIVAPSLPAIAEAFGDTAGAPLLTRLVLSLPAIFIAVSAPLAGRFIDKRGRLRLLYAGLVLYAASGTAGVYLDDLHLIVASRAVLGLSIGIVMTVTTTLIGDYFDGKERRGFLGYQAAFIGFSGVLFLTLGGVLADRSWRLPFWIYAVSVLLIPLVRKHLDEPDVSETGDWVGTLRSNRILPVIYTMSVLFMVLFYVIPTQLPFLLREFGLRVGSSSGAALAVNAFGMVLASMSFTRIKERMHFGSVASMAFVLMAAGYLLTGFTHSYAVVAVAMFIAGFGIGLFLPNTNLWVIELSPPPLRGSSIGLLTTCLFLGQFLSPLLAQPVVSGRGLSAVFLLSGVLTLVMAVGFLVGGRRLRRMEERVARGPE